MLGVSSCWVGKDAILLDSTESRLFSLKNFEVPVCRYSAPSISVTRRCNSCELWLYSDSNDDEADLQAEPGSEMVKRGPGYG